MEKQNLKSQSEVESGETVILSFPQKVENSKIFSSLLTFALSLQFGQFIALETTFGGLTT